jgi:hypothetical protein
MIAVALNHVAELKNEIGFVSVRERRARCEKSRAALAPHFAVASKFRVLNFGVYIALVVVGVIHRFGRGVVMSVSENGDAVCDGVCVCLVFYFAVKSGRYGIASAV